MVHRAAAMPSKVRPVPQRSLHSPRLARAPRQIGCNQDTPDRKPARPADHSGCASHPAQSLPYPKRRPPCLHRPCGAIAERRHRRGVARARRPARPRAGDLTGNIEDIDDFSACKITCKEDWVELYPKPYYFGCEADDRMNATAFGRNNPFGTKLNAIFSSDIGHFDVIDMRHPLPEAYELVEDGHITTDDFRAFTFTNAVRLWGTQNPKFFQGTRVAKQAAAVLAAAQTPTLAAAE